MEEEKKLPKNIRQMAEKEERVRVYLEDYAYTFINKLACTRRVRTGVLLGSRMIAENKRCWFVKGAVELEDDEEREEEERKAEGREDQRRQKELSKQRKAQSEKVNGKETNRKVEKDVDTQAEKEAEKQSDNKLENKPENESDNETINQRIWNTTQSVIQEYFPGCSICGWFICGSEENFPDGEQLKKTHRQIFSGENCLMYWKKGDEESFWIEEDDAILHLKGYFVYYEKNPEMQNYMVSRKEEASEDVSDEAALSFRKIMKEKQDTKHAQGFKHPNQQKHSRHTKHLNKEPGRDEVQDSIDHTIQDHTYNGLWIKACVAALFVALVGGGVLLSRGIKKKEDSVQALAVGASVERQSGELTEESLEQESQSEGQIQSTVEANMQLDAQIGSQTDTKTENQITSQTDTKIENQVTSQTDSQAKNPIESQTKTSEDSQMQAVGIFSGDMMFYKDGLGASVYRIADKSDGEDDKTQSQASQEEQSQENNPDGQQIDGQPADAQNTDTQNGDTQNEVAAASESTQEILTVEIPTVEAAVNRPASYTVQPGDTLIEISKKFYGSSQMVMRIKEANGLDDVNKIYIGQELTLP